MERKRLSKEKRREQIKEVALKLFIENGYSKTTMDEIVQEVGISKGGMYHHFSNKEEIFLELLKDGRQYRKSIVLDYMKDGKLDRKEKLLIFYLIKFWIKIHIKIYILYFL